MYALAAMLRQHGLFNSDELRDAIERLPPGQYLAASYYERWLGAIDAGRREGRAAVSYDAGDWVRVMAGDPDHHTRVPRYVRGHAGVIVAGSTMAGPRRLGRGVDPPRVQTCYVVRFPAADLWGSGDHTVNVDLWESYLDRS